MEAMKEWSAFKSAVNSDYRKHVWMVQSRDSERQIREYAEAGIEAISEWNDRLSKPVSGPRAVAIANDMENDLCDTRIVRAEVKS
jgi:hypothetical protein